MQPGEDTQDEEHVRRELEGLHLMLDASVDCIKVIDCDGVLLRMNMSGCIALGVRPGEFGMKWLDLLSRDIRARGRRALAAARRGHKASFLGKSEQPGGKVVHWDNILTPVLDAEGHVVSILCVSRDVTRQKEMEQKLRATCDIDALSGLPNRRYFARHIARLFEQLPRSRRRIGMLLIDVDRFKCINDRHGHEAGDHLLRTIADRFAALRRPDELIARLGGDEFVVVIGGVEDAQDLQAAAERLRGVLSRPITYSRTELSVSFSIGGALSSNELASVSALMKASDRALYAVKLAGRDGYRLFPPDPERPILPEMGEGRDADENTALPLDAAPS